MTITFQICSYSATKVSVKASIGSLLLYEIPCVSYTFAQELVNSLRKWAKVEIE